MSVVYASGGFAWALYPEHPHELELSRTEVQCTVVWGVEQARRRWHGDALQLFTIIPRRVTECRHQGVTRRRSIA
jgi:hypothetical protein